jgi:PAS domain S-box-containing protein
MATQVESLSSSISSSNELDALLRHLPMGAIIVDAPSGRFLSVNEHAAAMWGSDVPEVTSVSEYTHHFTGFGSNGRAYANDEWPISRALHGEVVSDEEIELRIPSGERRVMLVSAAPVRDDTGEIVRVVALLRDVTDERREDLRREFLMELSGELRMLDDDVAIMETAVAATGEHLGVSSVSYADVDPNARYAVVRAEYRNGRIAPAGKYHLDEFGAELVERVRLGTTVAVEDIASDPLGGSDVFEDWGIRSLLCVPVVRHGRLASMLTVMHTAPRRWTRSDVALVQQVAEWTWQSAGSARSQSELRQSREWLSLALRAGSAATWEWDLRTGEIHWSEEHGALLGLAGARRTLKFSRWLALVHPEDREAARNAGRRIAGMREGEVEFEHRLVGDENPRWVTMRGRVITDARGLPQRVVGVALDSTVRRMEALQREEALKQARDASDAKSHFIGVISHEFRTPLTAIIGYTELLSTGVSGKLSPVQDRQLDRIRACAWHLTHLVDEILTFSRIEAGREALTLEMTDIVAVAREARSLIAPTAAAKGLGLVGELPDVDVMSCTDGGKLRQVLLNLLGNAVKFTDKGGITLRVLPQGESVLFEVRDTGCGIAPEHAERIFERFWQANQDGSRAISGAGLGLTVSRHIVELLGGSISVESTPGAGSTFRFHLPIVADAAAAAAVAGAHAGNTTAASKD